MTRRPLFPGRDNIFERCAAKVDLQPLARATMKTQGCMYNAIRNAIIVCAAVFSAAATAQPPYPARPIRIIVPISPGAPPDVLARLVGERLSSALGQPVIVENRPGASGTIGIDAVAKAAADGHTLGMLTLGFLTAPALIAKMPYDTVRDLAAVTLVGKDANLLVVANGSSTRSVGDIRQIAKAKPGWLKFASGGNSTSAHLVGELFRREAGVEMVHVPYKGPLAGVAAVIAGEVDMMFGAVGVAATSIRSGRLRVLAVSSPQRIPAYPDVATLVELGFPGVTFVNWFGVVVPAATPTAVVARLHREIRTLDAAQETKQRLDAMGLESASARPEEFAALIRSDLLRMTKLVRDAGIKPD